MTSKKYSAFPAIDFYTAWKSVKENNPVLDKENFFFYASGRSALYHGVSCLPLTQRKKVLVPFYHCGVEVEAILRAGLEVEFYPLQENLDIDFSWLEENVTEDVGAILIIHFYGFPQPLEEIHLFCRRNGLFLLEDCAHALYSGPESGLLGEVGDLAIYSIMKTVALPNGGGLVINNKQLSPPRKGRSFFNLGLIKKTLRSILEFEANQNKKRSKVAAYFLQHHDRDQAAPSSKSNDPEESNKLWYYEVAQYHYRYGMSFLSSFFLKPMTVSRIVDQRQKNYETLLKHVHWNQNMQPLFKQCIHRVCPLCLPVRVQDSDQWNEELNRSGIRPFIFGRFSHPAFTAGRFPNSKAFRQGILGLPIHQQLQEDDMREIVQRINVLLR